MAPLAGISLLVVALDQFTKFLILSNLLPHESLPLLPDFLYVTYTQNTGMAFGFMSGMDPLVRVPFFIVATLGATAVVYMYQRMVPQDRWMTRIALGLIWGGALGNLVDRLLYGKVVDFIDMRYYDLQLLPSVFNVADICILTGVLYLLVEFLRTQSAKKPA